MVDFLVFLFVGLFCLLGRLAFLHPSTQYWKQHHPSLPPNHLQWSAGGIVASFGSGTYTNLLSSYFISFLFFIGLLLHGHLVTHKQLLLLCSRYHHPRTIYWFNFLFVCLIVCVRKCQRNSGSKRVKNVISNLILFSVLYYSKGNVVAVSKGEAWYVSVLYF